MSREKSPFTLRVTMRCSIGISPAKAGKGEILAWCLYDFANSSFPTIIITVAYSIYFVEVVASPSSRGDFLWGVSYAMSMLLAALSAPILGAIADFSGTKKRFLAFFTGLSILATAFLFFVGSGGLLSGMLLFALANYGFASSLVFYNAFLPEIAAEKDMGKVSGFGWALGYIGGLLSLALALPFIREGLSPGNLERFRFSFVIAAAHFLLFSFPLFLFLKERAIPRRGSLPGGILLPYIHVGLARLHTTFREIRRFRELAKFLLAFFIYNDAIDTVFVFSSIYAKVTLHFSMAELALFFVVVQIPAALGAFGFGFLVDRIGAKRSISITLIIWTLVTVGVFFTASKRGFFLISIVASLASGSCQAASRSLVGLFTPQGKSAEFFGFLAVCGKFSAILGPLTFGAISSFTGSQKTAVLSVGFFFLLGLLLLQTVREEEGMRAAKGYPA
ncbi:MAG: MFS transporter [Candidatus Methylomirabilales bacterium]